MSKPLPVLGLAALGILAAVSVAPARAAVELVISDLTEPVRLVAPVNDPRLFVAQRNGVIRVFDQAGAELDTLLDIRTQTVAGGERGLLGLAFPPDHAATGRFYVNFTDLQGNTRVARYNLRTGSSSQADPSSQEVILSVTQPYSNHNGGHLAFGPDGMLYIGLGDGGSGGDPENRAQDDQSLLGKMLRLDVGVPAGYAIPADNPFVGQGPRAEIWAKGLRNPWCYAFDRTTGDLYIADVGQGSVEEVDVQPAASTGGENYGWRLMEGDSCYLPATNCNDGSLSLPVATYTHGGSPFRCSISGGYVYRGSNLPSLAGQYFFADYCSRQIWSLSWTAASGAGPVIERTADMTPVGGYGAVASFGQDGLGELYILDLSRGRVYRLVSAVADSPPVQRRPFLAQNVPNPFNPRTAIPFAVARDGAPVTLAVYDPAGRLVRTLVSGPRPAGDQSVAWDGTNQAGHPVEAGVYLYRLVTDGVATSRKMLLLE
jgi:glucose/arabinose dehydrogenase